MSFKKHAPAICAFVLAGIFVLSAVWLRSSGIQRLFPKKTEMAQSIHHRNNDEEESRLHPPALGNVILAFSEEEMVYNPTTRVYEIHAGTDYLCPDANVYCIMDGRVADAFFDPLWGHTVCVLHENGDKSVYASLSEILVRKESPVRMGDVIGKSGISAAIEEKTGPHLHFEYIKNGKSYPISFTTAPDT